MSAIFKKEIRSCFLSPIAYIFIGTFMLIAGIFFSLTNVIGLSTNFASTLGSLTFVFMIIIPILTMRLFAQERKEKTDQLLLTSGVPVWDIVLAKFFASCTVYACALLLSLIFPMIISMFGVSLFGEMFSAYIGFFLLGLVMIAVGMFISSVTQSQIVAAILTAAVMMLLWIGDAAISLMSNNFLAEAFAWFSVFNRLEPFVLGILSLNNVVYYISFTVLFIYFTYASLEKRRWS